MPPVSVATAMRSPWSVRDGPDAAIGEAARAPEDVVRGERAGLGAGPEPAARGAHRARHESVSSS
jgi:hypothetical protein